MKTIEEGILETKNDCSAKDLLFLACFAFCVITFGPIMIYACSAPQNDHLIFSFDVKVVVKTMTRNRCKMIGKTADSLLCPFHSIQFLPLVFLPLWCKQVSSNFTFNTPHYWGHLGFLQPLPKTHTSPQYLKDLHWFEAFFKNFAHAVFEAIEVKGWLRLNFDAVTLKFCSHSWKFGYQPRKSKTGLCMTNGSKVLINSLWYLSFCNTYKSKSLMNSKKDK